MADAFSGTSALADQIIAAYDRNAFMALRAGAVFDQFARVKPGNVTSPGESVSFLFWADLSPATTALSETVDVDAVALSDSTVTLTPQEHGNAVLVTVRAQTDTLLIGFDPDIANIVSYNMLDSLETLAQEALAGAGNDVTVDGGAESSLTSTDLLTLDFVREQVADLKGDNVAPIDGSNYALIIHPDVAYDLMTATGDTDWSAFTIRQPANASEWKNGQIMQAAGVSFIESSRAPINADAGDTNTDTYDSYLLGQDAFGKAESIPPHIVPGPITDKLRRFMPLGWHAYLAYGAIRDEALISIVSASSIGANS